MMRADTDALKQSQKPAGRFSLLLWFAILAVTLGLLALRDAAPWLIVFPDEWVMPIVLVLNTMMTWVVEATGAFFRTVSMGLDVPMDAVRSLLTWLPWSVSVFILVSIAYAASGWTLSLIHI